MFYIEQQKFIFSSTIRRKIRDRKYWCSNLHFGICSIDLKGSKTGHPIHEIVFNFVPLAESREMGRELGDRITNFNGFWPIAIKWPIDHKISIKTSYRPALDPSENGTPHTRSRTSMPIESSNRRVEIPIGGHLGLFVIVILSFDSFVSSVRKKTDVTK